MSRGLADKKKTNSATASGLPALSHWPYSVPAFLPSFLPAFPQAGQFQDSCIPAFEMLFTNTKHHARILSAFPKALRRLSKQQSRYREGMPSSIIWFSTGQSHPPTYTSLLKG